MLGVKLAAALVRAPDGLSAFFKLGLNPELLKTPKEQKLGELIREHVAQYGKLPAETTLAEALGQKLPADVPEPAAYYHDQLRANHVHLELKKAALMVQAALNAPEPDPIAALALLQKQTLEISTHSSRHRVVDYSQEGAKIIAEEFNKKLLFGEEYGLQLGWPTFDKMAGGLTGGDVVSIVGRPAMGKSWLMLYIALNSWKTQLGMPLLVSMEMKPVSLVQRLAAMDATVNLTHLKTAKLSSEKLNHVLSTLSANKVKSGYWIVDGAMTSTIEDVVRFARQYKPSALYVDGAYLVKTMNTRQQRWERVAEVAERLKGEVAEALDIPVIASYQFNRDSTKLKKGQEQGLEHIAYADAVGQVSSVVLGLTEPDNIATKLMRRVSVLKGRNGESGEFFIRWSFDTWPMLDFSEVPKMSLEDLNYT